MTDNTQELDELALRLYRLKYNQLGGGAQELLAEVLDWHNKQVEEVLDRLIDQQWSFGEDDDALAVPTRYIEAERNKLKESKDGN